jgi:hypothetical protein
MVAYQGWERESRKTVLLKLHETERGRQEENLGKKREVFDKLI